MWVKDLAETRAGKLFLVLRLLLFTSIKCESEIHENTNLCYSLGIIFLIFDQYLGFNFVPKVSGLRDMGFASSAKFFPAVVIDLLKEVLSPLTVLSSFMSSTTAAATLKLPL